MDKEKVQKLPSGKRNKLQVPAFLTIDIEAHQDNILPTIICTEYSTPEAEINIKQDSDIIIELKNESFDSKIKDEKTKQIKTEYVIEKTSENWFSISIASWRLKQSFEGKKFQIVLDPLDGEPLIQLFVELSGDKPFELPEGSELKPEPLTDEEQ